MHPCLMLALSQPGPFFMKAASDFDNLIQGPALKWCVIVVSIFSIEL